MLHGKGQSQTLPRSPHGRLNITAISPVAAVPKMKTDGETLSKTTLENNSKLFMHKEPRADAGTRMHAHRAQEEKSSAG